MRRAPSLPLSLSLVVGLRFVAGCSGASEAAAPRADDETTAAPEAVPADPRAGLEPWSDAWIAAHAPAYLDDRAARRRALEASLTNPENLYSETRLSSYALERGGWDALPEWSPRTARLDASIAAALAAGAPLSLPEHAARIWDGTRPLDWAGWVALGERVFSELPLRAEPFVEVALRDRALGESLGVEARGDGSVPGVVVLADVDGRAAVGITCALCHTARAAGAGPDSAFVAGRARRTLDYGRLRVAFLEARGRDVDPTTRARYESWGPGRADVLEEASEIPIAIPDLWGLRHQRFLTQAGTLTHESPLALAIRQETQYVQANHLRTRPPRALAFALACYLYSLEPPPAPARAAGSEAELTAGALVFARECGSCHGSRIGSGELVEIERIGTEPELATGRARGTGRYRPAPLVRVADAAPYLHHGAVPTLEDVLSRARLEPGYARSPAGPGPVGGHEAGLDLADAERASLLRYLRSR